MIAIKLWLDDDLEIRHPKDFLPLDVPGFSDPSEWTWVTTAAEAIDLIKTGRVTHMSLDHDLGDRDTCGDGSEVANYVEKASFNNKIPKIIWHIHSANPVGEANMTAALKNADKFWDNHQR